MCSKCITPQVEARCINKRRTRYVLWQIIATQSYHIIHSPRAAAVVVVVVVLESVLAGQWGERGGLCFLCSADVRRAADG
jgi:hypothetical protein